MLALEELLIETNPDLPIVSTIFIGYSNYANLVLRYEHTDYDDETNTYIKEAIIDKEDAYKLAKKLNINLTELPQAIAKQFASEHLCEDSLAKAAALFNQILLYFSDNKVPYKIG